MADHAEPRRLNRKQAVECHQSAIPLPCAVPYAEPMNIGNGRVRQKSVRRIDLRRVAEYHAAGLDWDKTPSEAQRMIRLALNEAEALAAQTGVPELVLPSLAEEKVRAVKTWAARQKTLRAGQEWSLAA